MQLSTFSSCDLHDAQWNNIKMYNHNILYVLISSNNTKFGMRMYNEYTYKPCITYGSDLRLCITK
jgi:hypothetical protein